ncbi:hypothetical protein J2X36_002154 [Methylobacterium sp. BE186]|uniref:hypothetical protein n=1 Tax=Methylobacterium sp. BE186 TaxID=2817715 RepID=UPI002859807F|nr:hypothetical protein [Methylobacterium sp. BE186]MDR7037407.1 hypothetical protein [Methylobacterium sp. BE186]
MADPYKVYRSRISGRVPTQMAADDEAVLGIQEADGLLFTRTTSGTLRISRLITPEEYQALVAGIGSGGGSLPTLATVATSGQYADLIGRPTLFSGSYADLTGKPALFSGAYADLTGKPALFSGAYADLTGKPTFAAVATSGSASDLSTGTLLAARLPLPTSTTLGGVKSSTAGVGQFATGIGTDGVITYATPAGGGSGPASTDALPEGTSNLYFTQSRARASISATGSLAYNATTGVLSYTAPTLATVATTGQYADLLGKPTIPSTTDGLTEGTTNLYFTQARARASISATGSLAYNSTTGVLSYTAPTLAAIATSGSASDLTTGTVPAARLPAPTTTTLGGVQAKTAVASQFLTAISTAGVPASAQPTFTDISGTASAAQLPNPTTSAKGGVQANAGAASQFVTGISTATGALTFAQPAFTDISGTASAAQLPNPTTTTKGGVQANAGAANQFVTGISTSTGALTFAQPSISNISGGAWTTYTPTVTATTGTLTTLGTVSGRYQQLGKIVFLLCDVTITTNGTAGNGIVVTLPVAALTSSLSAISGREAASTGKSLGGTVNASQVFVYFYDGTHPGSNGARLIFTAIYEAA